MKHIDLLKIQIERLLEISPNHTATLKMHLNKDEVKLLKTWFEVSKVMGITWKFRCSQTMNKPKK